jgi:hypothetical protein
MATIVGVVPAGAQPLDDLVSNPGMPAVGWRQLGLSDQIELVGTDQPVGIVLPVPAGVVPVALTGQIGSAARTDGRVDVLDGRGVVIGSIPLPATPATVPFSVDLSSAQVINGKAGLSFRIRDHEPGRTDSCVPPATVLLGQLATTYSGPTPDPGTVADFLPGYLDQITIAVGPRPTTAQQQAALTLVAKLTQMYRPMPVRIDVDASAEPPRPPGRGTGRVIEIRESDAPGLVVQNPATPEAVLLIAGRGEQLREQVELFSGRGFELAQTASASVISAPPDVATTGYTRTFGQLNMATETTVQGVNTLYLGFDAAAFGVGSIERARVRLMAHYTPVVAGHATVLIRSGSTVLAARQLDDSGSLDTTVDLPPETIASNVGLAVEIRYNPERDCPPLTDRLTFAVDARSVVTVTPGANNRGGFPALPMAFTPDFDVVLDQPELLGHAAQVVNLLAQQSTVVLRPRITTLDEAAGRHSGLLMVAPGGVLTRAGFQPPILATGTGVADINGSPLTDIDVNGPLGVIQAFTQNGRMVVAVNATGDWSLIDRAVEYIRGLDNRWASLSGDVVATGPAGASTNLTIRAGEPTTPQPALGTSWTLWVWCSIAAVGVAVLVIAVIVVLRWRSRRV